MKKIVLLLFVLCLVVFSFSKSGVASDDWQYWNEFVFEHEINEKWESVLKAEQKFSDDCSDCTTYNFSLEGIHKINNMHSLGFGYMYEKEKADDEWPREHRFTTKLITKWKIDNIKLKLYNKLEYRDFEEEKDKWRYRLKLKGSTSVDLNGFSFNPFISDEVFYDFDDNELNKNRFAFGIEKGLTNNIEASLYYLRETSKNDNDNWPGINVIGTEFVIVF